jgi:hypothetical protein
MTQTRLPWSSTLSPPRLPMAARFPASQARMRSTPGPIRGRRRSTLISARTWLSSAGGSQPALHSSRREPVRAAAR